jgi:DNA-binding NtrC family response regulator
MKGLEGVLYNSGAGIIIFDIEHRIKWFNNKIVQWFGALRTEESRSCYKIQEFGNSFCSRCLTKKTFDNGIPSRYQLTFPQKENSRIFEIIAIPLNDNNAKVMELVIDLTEDRNNEMVSSYNYQGIVGISPSIKDVIKTIHQIKNANLPVIICGESGTGKELVARALHFDSIRNKKPFIAINCASLKPELLENELFGHVKGAFTGATDAKDGLLKLADSGTLFIDEIADMNLSVQASLLRFIETGIFRPLGSTKEINVEIRIVAAINRNIECEVKAGKFRHDLYYRLNVCRIDIPPLRERKEDIPYLVEHFLKSFPLARERGSNISESAMQALLHYTWPGNVRELFNVLGRAILLSVEATITKPFIESIIPSNHMKSSQLIDIEKKYIIDCLNTNNWNISRTSKDLAIDRRTLQRKIARYSLK